MRTVGAAELSLRELDGSKLDEADDAVRRSAVALAFDIGSEPDRTTGRCRLGELDFVDASCVDYVGKDEASRELATLQRRDDVDSGCAEDAEVLQGLVVVQAMTSKEQLLSILSKTFSLNDDMFQSADRV